MFTTSHGEPPQLGTTIRITLPHDCGTERVLRPRLDMNVESQDRSVDLPPIFNPSKTLSSATGSCRCRDHDDSIGHLRPRKCLQMVESFDVCICSFFFRKLLIDDFQSKLSAGDSSMTAHGPCPQLRAIIHIHPPGEHRGAHVLHSGSDANVPSEDRTVDIFPISNLSTTPSPTTHTCQ